MLENYSFYRQYKRAVRRKEAEKKKFSFNGAMLQPPVRGLEKSREKE